MTMLKKDYSGMSAYITLHHTANTANRADAKKHANYVKKPSSSVSWHFTCDDSVIYQHFPIDENGWHAGEGTNGTGNRTSIGIEICDGDFEQTTEMPSE